MSRPKSAVTAAPVLVGGLFLEMGGENSQVAPPEPAESWQAQATPETVEVLKGLGLLDRKDVQKIRVPRVKARKPDPQTWALAGGVGWLYGMGAVCGPFYGVGVGLTFPGGIIAGAGAGVGIVVGIGMGGGLVWGSGRGSVAGFGVPVPMEPPTLPSWGELTDQVSDAIGMLQGWRRELASGETTVTGTLGRLRPQRKRSLALIGAPRAVRAAGLPRPAEKQLPQTGLAPRRAKAPPALHA